MNHKISRLIISGFVLVSLCAATFAQELNPDAPTWQDPPLNILLQKADVIAEFSVLLGGQWQAICIPENIFVSRKSPLPKNQPVIIEGFNSFKWNTLHHSLQTDTKIILALAELPSKNNMRRFSLFSPSSGRFPLERENIIASLPGEGFSVELEASLFKNAIAAFINNDEGAILNLLTAEKIEARYIGTTLISSKFKNKLAAAELLGQFKSEKSAALRRGAIKALAQLGTKEATHKIATFLTDRDERTSATAASKMAKLFVDGSHIESLLGWLESVEQRKSSRKISTDARIEVLSLWASEGWNELVKDSERAFLTRWLTKILGSAKTSTAALASRVLGAMRSQEAVELLTRMLRGQDERLVSEAENALFAITLSPVVLNKGEFQKIIGTQDIAKMRTRNLSSAALGITSSNQQTERLSLLILAYSQSPDAPYFARARLATKDGWPELHLGNFRGPLTLALAELRLASSDSGVVRTSLAALRSLAKEMSVCNEYFESLFLRTSYFSTSEIAQASLDALKDVGGKKSCERLLKELEIGDAESALLATRSLESLTGQSFGEVIPNSLFVENISVQQNWNAWFAANSHALKIIHPAPNENLPQAKSPALAVKLLRATDGKKSDRNKIKAIRALLQNSEDVTSALIELAEDSDSLLNSYAAALLGFNLPKNTEQKNAAQVALNKLLTHTEPFVRLQAAWALGQVLKGTGTLPPELETIALGAIRAVSLKEPESLDARFINAFESAIDITQVAAINALGKIGGARATQILTDALNSNDSLLSESAAWALGTHEEMFDVLARFGLNSKFTHVRKLSATSLAVSKNQAHASALADALKTSDILLAEVLGNALSHTIDANNIELLLSAATGQNTYATRAALTQVTRCLDSKVKNLALAKTDYEIALNAIAPTAPGEPPDTLLQFSGLLLLNKMLEAPRASKNLSAEQIQKAAIACADIYDGFEPMLMDEASKLLVHLGEGGRKLYPALLRFASNYESVPVSTLPAKARFGGISGLINIARDAKNSMSARRYFAINALAYAPAIKTQSEFAIGELIKIWLDEENPYQDAAERAILLFGSRAQGQIENLLSLKNSKIVRRAIFLLMKFKNANAVNAIERTRSLALKNNDQKTARVASTTLKMLGKTKMPPSVPEVR